MRDRCKSAIFDARVKKFSIVEFELPNLNPGEILVEVHCCTICGSDLHTFSGRRSGPSSCVLGHEIIGIVADYIGSPPSDFFGNPVQRGQKVTWNLAVGCGECFYCKSGLPQKCGSLFKYGHEAFDGSRPTGGFSTHCVLAPRTTIFTVPDRLPDSVICPANCATATVAAAVRTLQETHQIKNAHVGVFGMGMLGLTATSMIHRLGAQSIVCVETNPDRLKAAAEFGCTHVANVEANSSNDSMHQLPPLGERGLDASLEFSGANSAVNSSLQHLRNGGAAVLAGSVFPTDPIEIPPEQIVRRILTIRGIHNYRPDDLANALSFLEGNFNRYPFANLVSQEFPLNRVNDAFAAAANGKHIRVAVNPRI